MALLWILLGFITTALGAEPTVSDGVTEVETTEAPPVKVTTVLIQPWMSIDDEVKEPGNARFKGFLKDVLDEIFEKMDRTYKLQVVRDGRYGMKDKSSGRWVGMVGEVTYGDVDMAAGPLSITDSRKDVVAFSDPWAEVSLTALIKDTSPIDSLEELVNQTEITYGVVDGGSTETAFREAKDEPYTTMYFKFASNREETLVDSFEEGVNKARNGTYAFIMEDQHAEYEVYHKCGLKTIGSFLPQGGYGMALHKDSNLIDPVNKALKELKESGDLEDLKWKWWRGPCGGAAGLRGMTSLSVVTSLAAIVALVCGRMA